MGSGDHRGAASRALVDYCHFTDNAARLEGFVDGTAADNPQGALLDDVERVRCVAFSKQKLPGTERNRLAFGEPLRSPSSELIQHRNPSTGDSLICSTVGLVRRGNFPILDKRLIQSLVFSPGP